MHRLLLLRRIIQEFRTDSFSCNMNQVLTFISLRNLRIQFILDLIFGNCPNNLVDNLSIFKDE